MSLTLMLMDYMVVLINFVAIHVGNEPAKQQELSRNPLCAYVWGGSFALCAPHLVGQHLLIQNLDISQQLPLGLNEVTVGFDLNLTGNKIKKTIILIIVLIYLRFQCQAYQFL